jgi:hypothetical protein
VPLLDLDTAQRQREGAVPDTDAMKALPSHEPGQKHRLDLQIYVPKLLVSYVNMKIWRVGWI